MVTLQLRQLEIPPGQRLLIHGLDWAELEAILAELGEKRRSRIAYLDGVLEIHMPLAEHEVDKELISDVIKTLLDELGIDYECFGSTTFKKPEADVGLEPDQSFYIRNQALMRGKRRVNLSVDPPPDLALEVDVTSKTQQEAYARLGVPELWVYSAGELRIYQLQGNEYQPVDASPTFPQLPVKAWVQATLTASQQVGRSQALHTLRQTVRDAIAQGR